ncbi:MAG: hypothetical protein AB7I27_07205 [Bacteriovoracaceae bacterium]
MKYLLIYFSIFGFFYSNLWAKINQEKKLNFKFKAEALMNGDIHFSMKKVSLEKLKKKYSKYIDLDTVGLLKNKNDQFVLTKAVFVLKKDVGFFDHEQMINEDFMKSYYKDSKVIKINENSFKINNDENNFVTDIYYDSDDISTLKTSKIVKAVTLARKLDLLSQSSSSIVFRDFTEYSKKFDGSIEISINVPLKEARTLIINYRLYAVKPGTRSDLYFDIASDIARSKKIIEEFKR